MADLDNSHKEHGLWLVNLPQVTIHQGICVALRQHIGPAHDKDTASQTRCEGRRLQEPCTCSNYWMLSAGETRRYRRCKQQLNNQVEEDAVQPATASLLNAVCSPTLRLCWSLGQMTPSAVFPIACSPQDSVLDQGVDPSFQARKESGVSSINSDVKAEAGHLHQRKLQCTNGLSVWQMIRSPGKALGIQECTVQQACC